MTPPLKEYSSVQYNTIQYNTIQYNTMGESIPPYAAFFSIKTYFILLDCYGVRVFVIPLPMTLVYEGMYIPNSGVGL